MKRIILFIAMSFAIIAKLDAQTLEHFNVKDIKSHWVLTPKFDESDPSGLHALCTGNLDDSAKWIYSNLSKLPEAIKKEIFLKINKYRVFFYFNSNGEITKQSLFISKKGRFVLNNEQLLKVYNTIRQSKMDMSELEIADDFGYCGISIPLLQKNK